MSQFDAAAVVAIPALVAALALLVKAVNGPHVHEGAPVATVSTP